MNNMLYGALALISAIATGVSFWQFQRKDETYLIILTLVFLVAAIAFGAMFLTGRVNKTDDIHITE
ncbi:MAG: hypothetical protein ACR2MG_09115 [Pyrinomonadaceae bacterium]